VPPLTSATPDHRSQLPSLPSVKDSDLRLHDCKNLIPLVCFDTISTNLPPRPETSWSPTCTASSRYVLLSDGVGDEFGCPSGDTIGFG